MGIRLCDHAPGCTIPYGTCHCGCGEKTRIAQWNESQRRWKAGEPIMFLKGHAGGREAHPLTDIDQIARTAYCSLCGIKVTIKSRGPAGRNGQERWRCTGQLITQHRLTRINELDETAFCRGCGKLVPITRHAQRAKGQSGQGWICSSKRKEDAQNYRDTQHQPIQEKHKTWRDANPDKIRGYKVKRLYGIPLDEYLAEIARRDGRCDICGKIPQDTGTNGQTLCVEHNHETKEIRGYVDSQCNIMIGGAGDDPVRLAQGIVYLKPSRAVLTAITEMLLDHLESQEAREIAAPG